MKSLVLLLIPLFLMSSCKQQQEELTDEKPIIYLGADLSYVNEVEDCGATYRYQKQLVDPYALFKQKGCNLVRLRLWHTPEASPYADLRDVARAIARAKKQHMHVLLDFHYSDTWADPEKQYIPKAWKDISDLNILGDSLYQYTYQTLTYLHIHNLLPEMVQIGNETNSEILQPYGTHKEEIDWARMVFLLNQGLKAVSDFNKKHQIKVETMLHIAQPENALTWFEQAHQNGIADYDWIGISYYPLWSEYKFDTLPDAIKTLVDTYQKRFMIVETAYPYSLENFDQAGNILGEKSLIPGYEPTPEGQRKYMMDLTKICLDAGGLGVIYWEPAWVSSSCKTLWGTGSHWENATFFDAANQNEALPVFDFFERNLSN